MNSHRCDETIGGKTRTSDVIASRCLASDWLADGITYQCVATDSRKREPPLRPENSPCSSLSFLPSCSVRSISFHFPSRSPRNPSRCSHFLPHLLLRLHSSSLPLLLIPDIPPSLFAFISLATIEYREICSPLCIPSPPSCSLSSRLSLYFRLSFHSRSKYRRRLSRNTSLPYLPSNLRFSTVKSSQTLRLSESADISSRLSLCFYLSDFSSIYSVGN